VPNIPAIIWWILGLWFGLALVVGAAASRWFRFLRDPEQKEYNKKREERTNGGKPATDPTRLETDTENHDRT